MVKMLMASSSKSLPTPSIPTTHKPKFSPLKTHFSNSLLKNLNFSLLKSATIIVASLSLSFLLPHPSLAEEIEKALIFDFNLTLPIIMDEFLLLMFPLD